jgi:hypothetical protein
MADYRLAMVACMDAIEGPWTFAKGNEVGVQIIHLMEGERIRLELDYGKISDHVEFDSPGAFPLKFGAVKRYRVCKIADEGVVNSPTTVKVKLHGATN